MKSESTKSALVSSSKAGEPAASPLLTVDEVAAWLRVARKTILNWVYTGQLASVKFGKRLRFKREDVEALIASRYKAGQSNRS